jgi:hypothetical protein
MTEAPNPYAAPKSDIELIPASPSRRVGWRVYALAIAGLQIIGFMVDLRKINLAEVLDDLVTMVGMIGLLGYAFRRRIGGRRIWMLWAVLFPVSNAVIGLWIYPHTGTGGHLGYFVAMLLFFPQYLAVFRYGYRSPEIWRGAAGSGAVSSE